MKILLTGGAGFIGSHLAEAFLGAGHDVVVVDDLSTGHREQVPAGARFHALDIRSTEAAALVAAEKPDALCLHAAQMNVRRSVDDPAWDADINVVGMVRMLEAARLAGTRKVVFASSGGTVYGEVGELPTPEDHDTVPLCPYGVGKRAGEHYLEYYHRVHGLQYVSLVVGRPDLATLVVYELVMLLTQWVPGALGLVLRKTFYPGLLGSCGRNVVFGQNVVLRHPHKIHIGDNVVIDDNCLVDAKGETNTGIRIGSGVFIGRNSILSCKNGDIELADGANIGFNCEIFSAGQVRIGEGTLLAAYTYVIGGDHDVTDPTRPVQEQARKSDGVRIGAGAWLGAGVKVLDGVTIGDGAIVGAGAVVTKDVPERSVAVGVPAKVVADR